MNKQQYIKRSEKEDGSAHFYFMTLNANEIVDASKKGNLARFINHSCNPNCVTQKWIVGSVQRMGIFAKTFIKAGTELSFDYKFVRYGADAQVCRCGEPNCKGTIGESRKVEVDHEDGHVEKVILKPFTLAQASLLPSKIAESIQDSSYINEVIARLNVSDAPVLKCLFSCSSGPLLLKLFMTVTLSWGEESIIPVIINANCSAWS